MCGSPSLLLLLFSDETFNQLSPRFRPATHPEIHRFPYFVPSSVPPAIGKRLPGPVFLKICSYQRETQRLIHSLRDKDKWLVGAGRHTRVRSRENKICCLLPSVAVADCLLMMF